MDKLKLQIPLDEDPRARPSLDTVWYIKKSSAKVIGVTGASGAGKDSFVSSLEKLMPFKSVVHLRFGDVMKDMAYQYGMVPYSRSYYEQNREARFEKLPNGKTALDAWIALDVIREYNPYVFIQKTLEDYINRMNSDTQLLVFSGMRTEAGLSIVDRLADNTVRIERPSHKPPEGATLDSLQVEWPVREVILNDGRLKDLEGKAHKVLEELWKN